MKGESNMTIEEKKKAIKKHCAGRRCVDCKLHPVLGADEVCFSTGANIERNYAILFGEESEPDPNASANADNVNHPKHYESGKFECIDVMIETQGVEAVKGFCLCNAFKYLYRHNHKNGVEDIKKARWYIDKYIELTDQDSGAQ